MAAQSRGSAFPDTTAVPLVDGGIDDRTKEVCQTGGTARIYGMISVCRVFANMKCQVPETANKENYPQINCMKIT